MTAKLEPTFDLNEAHDFFARSLHGACWDLLEKERRTPEEDERMLLVAHASAYHWLHAGGAKQHQRGAWLISRAYATLGRAEEAMRWAERARALLEAHPGEMADFDFAFVEEALARAHAAGGSAVEAAEHRGRASELGERIAEDEDRTIFFDELRREPWFGAG